MKRKLAAAMALILVILMILAVIAPYIVKAATPETGTVSEVYSETDPVIEGQDRDFQAEIEDLEEQINTLTAERNSLLNQYADLVNQSEEKQNQINKLLDEIATLTKQIAELDEDIQEQEGIITGLKMEIAMKETEIEEQSEKLAKAQENAKQYTDYLSYRLKQMYEQPEQSYLEMLLSAENLADFFCKLENIRQVYEYDKKCVKELRIIRDSIANYKEALETVQESLEADRAEAERLCSELEKNRKLKAELLIEENDRETAMETELRDLVEQTNAKAGDVDEKDEEIALLQAKLTQVKADQAEFRRKQEELLRTAEAVQSRSELSGYSFFWPLWDEECAYVLEKWGYHYHPISGKWTKHYGCDTPADIGTPIHAAESGTVIAAYQSGWNSGYGNLIIIQHQTDGNANSIQTWYGHCSQVYVKVGQHVNRGDVIGAVGSTGNSTGPHLHLELIINGTDVDPELYIPKAWPIIDN